MRARRQAGFTLLEVVVAFVVLALVLSSVLQIFSSGLSRSADLEEHSRALAVAQARLATVGIEEAVKEGETTGQTADNVYRWSVRISPHVEAKEALATPPGSFILLRADAKVDWKSADGRARNLTLSTLHLAPPR